MKSQFNNLLVYLVLFLLPLQIQSQTWVPQAIDLLPVDYAVFSISVVDENVVWAVAFDRTASVPVEVDHIIKVLKTTDGGANWDVYNVMEAIGRISFDIVAFDQDNAFITTQTSGNNGFVSGVFKTEDGGGSWTQKSFGYTGSVWIRFFNQTDGVIINRGNMATTDDGGETWVPVPTANIPAFQTDESTLISTGTNSCQVIGDHIWFGTNQGRVYRSQDKGLNWEVFETSFGNTATVISEAFKNTLDGIAVDVSSSITKFSKTTDGGETWTNVTSSPGLGIRNIAYIPGIANTLIGISDFFSNPITAYSVDFGETWRIIDENIPFRATQFISSTVGWATKSRITSSDQAAMYKWDGSDIFDCNPASESFPDNPLTHTGSGSSSTEVTFAPGSKTPSFTISGLNSKTSGSPNNRYIDEVTVTYVYENGTAGIYGTFSGSNTNSVTVDILKSDIESVMVELADGYDGNYSGTLSVSFSDISYCSAVPACPDADNDGVCDVDDVCPGFDDNLIGTACDDGDVCTEGETWGTDCLCSGGIFADDDDDTVCNANDICPGDDDTIDLNENGIPDCSENNSCPNVFSEFSPNPLTHSGTGSSESVVTFPVGNTDVSFTISGLGQKQNGNPNKKYIEQVTVTYDDGSGNMQPFGNGDFSGAGQSTVEVDITGPVQSVTLSLTNIHPDNPPSADMSINMTTITSCIPPSAMIQQNNTGITLFGDVGIYPNPVTRDLYLRFKNAPEEGEIILFNVLGTPIAKYQLTGQVLHRIDLNALNLSNQALFVSIRIPGQEPVTRRVVFMK